MAAACVHGGGVLVAAVDGAEAQMSTDELILAIVGFCLGWLIGSGGKQSLKPGHQPTIETPPSAPPRGGSNVKIVYGNGNRLTRGPGE